MATRGTVRSRRGGVPTLIFLAVVMIAVAAFLAPGWWGAIPLLAGAGFLGYLLAHRWPELPGPVLALRALVIIGLVAFALYKIV